MTAVVFDRPMNTLFHCFNGSNRSCAALRAWLIVAWNYSAGAAIELLLVQRKAQRLWKLEGYMLDALHTVDMECKQWQQSFAAAGPAAGLAAGCPESIPAGLPAGPSFG